MKCCKYIIMFDVSILFVQNCIHLFCKGHKCSRIKMSVNGMSVFIPLMVSSIFSSIKMLLLLSFLHLSNTLFLRDKTKESKKESIQRKIKLSCNKSLICILLGTRYIRGNSSKLKLQGLT